MEAGRLLRAARREAGLSQRALAERADLSRHTVEDAESGRCSPRYEVLVQLLAACGQELVMRPLASGHEPVEEQRLVAWLRRSLCERLARTCGEPYARSPLASEGPWSDLIRLGSLGPVSAIDGPLAYGAWLPDQALRGEQRLTAHAWRPAAPGTRRGDVLPPLVLLVSPDPPPRALITVPLPPFRSLRSAVLVPPPDSLLASAPPQLREPLRRAAQLLHERGPRTGSGRRPAAHREADVRRELARWADRYATRPPAVTEARTWRLDGAGSLAELARRSGAQPWPRKPGWSRWGWR